MKNTGYVVVGLSHNTSEFAVSSISRWWQDEGQEVYPGAAELMILADGGGGNGYRSKAWRWNLQEKICNRYRLTVTVCHYPPGCSKWNPVEHRLFSQISNNWAGVPLRSLADLAQFRDILSGFPVPTCKIPGFFVVETARRPCSEDLPA
jgi:hypothetical protein